MAPQDLTAKNTDNKGGPAFPGFESPAGGYPGMSLLDYFAGQALPAVVDAYIAANGSCIGADHAPRNCAGHAYRYAHAMLRERSEGRWVA